MNRQTWRAFKVLGPIGVALAALSVAFLSLVPTGAHAQRAMVFDGSLAKGDTFVVDLGSPSPVSLGTGGFVCSESSHLSPGGIVTPPPQSQPVEPAGAGLTAGRRDFLASPPPLPPLVIDSLEDDCDVVAQFAQVQAHLDQLLLDAASMVAAQNACLVEIGQAYCDFVAAVESIAISPESAGNVQDGSQHSSSTTMTFFSDCDEVPFCGCIASILHSPLPFLLDEMNRELANCEEIRDRLIARKAELPAADDPFNINSFFDWADARLAESERLGPAMVKLQSDIGGEVSTITLAAAQANCDECPSPFLPRSFFFPPFSIEVARDDSVISSLAGAFSATASSEADLALAARYAGIAQKLPTLPTDRILYVSHPTDAPGETLAIGLRSSSLPDDGVSPLAVIIRADPSSSTPMGIVDRRVVLDAWRALSRTVDPAATSADPADDDGDGLRDAFETQTGIFASFVDTGTTAGLVDTDADLFTDGTEALAGSDPNDPTSSPLTLAAAVPVLAPVGAALAALLLARAGMRRISNRRQP